MTDQATKARRFLGLHGGKPFLLPNPWDVGSALVLEGLGFAALATTSSGHAFTLGRPDGGVTLDEVTAHISVISSASSLPLSADLENGYGERPEDAAQAITRAAEAGAVGGSIEDFDPRGHIYDLSHATERVQAAAETAQALGFPFTFTARAENFVNGNPDLDDTIARLLAFERAGADVLYAPSLRNTDEVRLVCEAVSKPVNVLAIPTLNASEVFAAGAQRISIGGGLAWVAVRALTQAAKRLREGAELSELNAGSPPAEWLTG